MKISDEKLYELCKVYGERARFWRQKFAGLLPEVYKRRLFEKKGMNSIFEFAKKLAGMNEKHVRRVLNIEERFRDKPILKGMLENGDISINKLARVVSVATPDNQLFWAAQAKVLFQGALETLVRDQKVSTENTISSTAVDHMNGLQQPKSDDKSVRVHTNQLNLSPEVHKKLLELQQKGIDVNTLLLEFLEKREQEITEEKKRIAEEIEQHKEFNHDAVFYGVPIKKSRYISASTKALLAKEFGTKCAVPQCKKQAQEIHHTNRFSLSKSHNPYFLAPLCKEHHQIAHSIDVKFYEKRAGGRES
ncbi:hypothetical protein HYW83_04515 [Candidatus Peregrinibacteria bacterium]|nr:hypothetical protein [Candidatus Peregrinibacteria bacterium]